MSSIPEVNIGLVGHVDHGKCISLDQDILVNNELVEAGELAEKAREKGKKIGEDQDGELYEIRDLYTYSVDKDSNVERKKAHVYIQDYSGDLKTVETVSGRSIELTESHPLLVNENGELEWKPAGEVEEDDYIAVPEELPLEEREVEINDNWAKEIDSQVITSDDLKNLGKKASKEVSELVRKSLQLSKREFAEKCGISEDSYLRWTRGETEISEQNRGKIREFIKTSEARMEENEVLIVYNSGDDYRSDSFKEMEVNKKFTKFLAFLTAEGRMTDKRIELCQRDHKSMRDEVLEYLENRGHEIRQESDKDYFINSKGLSQYLESKFGVKKGSSREAGIPGIIHSMPRELKSLFIEWFFSFEADIRSEAGQITITQANRDNINRLSYLLTEFGIRTQLNQQKKEATNSGSGKRTYYQLNISGSRNLENYSEKIGFGPEGKREKLENAIRTKGCSSNKSIPVDFEKLDEALEILKAKTNSRDSKKGLKQRKWYKGLEESRKKGKMTEKMFEKIEQTVREEAAEIREIESMERLHELMDRAAISSEEIGEEIGSSKSQTQRYLRGEKGREKKEEVFQAAKNLSEEKIEKSLEKLEEISWLFEASITFEPVKNTAKRHADEQILDLTVPENHNFFAGYGGILCHNTTLTNALSGKWTDEHSEELKKGITIRIGYADVTYYEDSDGFNVDGNGEEARTVSLVDAPGHETLMANVLSGAAIMDGAILLVAANEEVPQPQTREHLAALDIIGIDNIVIVQNKIDLVSGEEARENYKQIQEFVEDTVAEDAPIVPVSAQHGVNIDLLLEAVDEEIPTPERDEDADPKMLVARSFDINKPGTTPEDLKGGVVGGSLVEGELEEGDKIEMKPGIRVDGNWEAVETSVDTILHGGQPVEKGKPGGLLAVETELDPLLAKSDGLSGNVLGLKGEVPDTADSLEIDVELMDRLVGSEEEKEIENVKKNEALMLNIGTGKSAGIVTQAGDRIKVDLKMPICAEEDDRVAISRQIGSRWRLIGHGKIVSKN